MKFKINNIIEIKLIIISDNIKNIIVLKWIIKMKLKYQNIIYIKKI